MTEKLVWHVVKEFAAKIGVSKLAPHDLRRSWLGSAEPPAVSWRRFSSVQTTERYLGCTQRISLAVNDRIGIEPKT